MRSTRGLVWLTIGTALALLTLALTAYKADLNAERHARFRERDHKRKAVYALGREVRDRMGLARQAQMSIEDFQEEFGPLSVLKDMPDPKSEDTHSFYHEQSQRTFYLRFEDGQLMGYGSNHGTARIDSGVILETRAFLLSESIRHTVHGVAFIAWCLVLIGSLPVGKFRRKCAGMLTVLSVVCGLCWLLKPNFPPTWRGIRSNDSLCFFVIMLLCSLGFGLAGLAPDSRETESEQHKPRRSGIAATAVVAVLIVATVAIWFLFSGTPVPPGE